MTRDYHDRGRANRISDKQMLALFIAVATFTTPPTLGAQSRRDVILGAFAAGAAFTPAAAFAGPREDGIKLLRKQAAAPKGPPKAAKPWIGPPKGSGADKCSVSKPCTSGAGLKWDPVALGVKKGEGGTSTRTFLKTKTYANSPY